MAGLELVNARPRGRRNKDVPAAAGKGPEIELNARVSHASSTFLQEV